MKSSKTMRKRLPNQRRYDMAFKVTVAQAVIEAGQKPAEVAVAHDTSVTNVHKWVQQAERGELDGYTPPTDEAVLADPMAEVRRLRRTVADLRQQCDFLKKTAAFFATDLRRGVR